MSGRQQADPREATVSCGALGAREPVRSDEPLLEQAVPLPQGSYASGDGAERADRSR